MNDKRSQFTVINMNDIVNVKNNKKTVNWMTNSFANKPDGLLVWSVCSRTVKEISENYGKHRSYSASSEISLYNKSNLGGLIAICIGRSPSGSKPRIKNMTYLLGVQFSKHNYNCNC